MQKEISYIAIDDNELDLLLLSEYIKQYSIFKSYGCFTNTTDGLLTIKTLKPQLVFLDIEMPEQNGISFANEIKNLNTIIIFITSHVDFAIEGFLLNALDYLVKPITADRFALTINKVIELDEIKQKATAYDVLFGENQLTIKDGYTQIKINQNDIIFLEAMQDYTKIVTVQKNYLVLSTLSNFMEKLLPNKFLRVHRSYAIATAQVTAMDAAHIYCGTHKIPIGKTYKTLIKKSIT